MKSLRGFTLVEVMVALTILSLILLATVTSLRTFGNTQTTLEQVTSRIDEVRTVSGFLRGALGSAVVGEASDGLSLGGGGASAETLFKGDAAGLQWRAALLLGEGYGGTFLLRVGAEDGDLVLRWLDPELIRTREPDWGQSESRVLVKNLEDLRVDYREDVFGEWLPEWDGRGNPALVRMNIRARGRYWPELIMQVQQ